MSTPRPRRHAAAPCRKSKNERIVDDRATEGETDGALSKSIASEGGGIGFISADGREKALPLRRNIKTAVKKGLPT